VIYPTRRAIVLMAAGAPAALLIGLALPGYWSLGGAWVALILGLILVDALIGPARSEAEIEIDAPAAIGVGARGTASVTGAFSRQAPRSYTLALEANALLGLSLDRVHLQDGAAQIEITPLRRGEGEIVGAWLRWPGPLGLVWKQIRRRPKREIAVIPNVQAVKDEAIRLFSRDALFGIKTQLDTGDGADFHALREMVGAMDTRTIDWKQSARHGKLLGKEFRVERNHPIVFAIDGGRQMCEPLLGVPRIDRALNAALMLAYVSLRLGDRAGLFGFDSAPRLYTGVLAGAQAFDRLRWLSSQLDYSTEETNYTLGLTQLGAALKRRSLVVVFTDFADATSAELMVENVTRLVRRHLVLFVVLRDEELEAIVRRAPLSAEDVTRAVTAAALLKARDVVLERLRRLGVHIVDAPAARLGPALISAYLDLKRRDLM
jgi:uncharacterized protein (DUF58 family)